MLTVDVIAERLIRAGVRHVFGVGGANIEDLFSAVQRRRPELQAVLCKHEHAAGTAADAYARLRGDLGVVMVTSGGAAMNLVHALAEARASGVPILALVGEPPTALQGRGAFQDSSGRGGTIDGAAVFGAVARHCVRVREASEVPAALEAALAAALGREPGPAVLLLAKDLQRTAIEPTAVPPFERRVPEPDADAIRGAVARLRSRPVLVVAGPTVAHRGAQRELRDLATRLDADVAVTPDARDAFDDHDPRFVGIIGAMGRAPVARALAEAATCVLVGTRLPLLARAGHESLLRDKPMVSLGDAPPFVGPPDLVHVDGDVGACLRACLAALPGPDPAPRPRPRPEPEPVADGSILRASDVMRALGPRLPPGSTVLVDAGNTGATAIHDLPAPPDGRWLIAMGMAGMGWTFGAATGAAHATGGRCIVIAGDGAFYMHGLDIHTAVEHRLPITYVVLDNAAHGMCLVRERLLLGENAGYNVFRRSHLGTGLAAMFPGLVGFDCRTAAELEHALDRALGEPGPAVVGVELADVEIPPFAAFGEAAGPGATTVPRDGGTP